MAEVLSFHEGAANSSAREYEDKTHSLIESNIAYARMWYKNKKWIKGMRIRSSSAGGPKGSIKNGLIEISFQPPFGSPFPNLAQVVGTYLEPSTFKECLDKVYNTILEHAQRHEDKKNQSQSS